MLIQAQNEMLRGQKIEREGTKYVKDAAAL